MIYFKNRGFFFPTKEKENFFYFFPFILSLYFPLKLIFINRPHSACQRNFGSLMRKILFFPSILPLHLRHAGSYCGDLGEIEDRYTQEEHTQSPARFLPSIHSHTSVIFPPSSILPQTDGEIKVIFPRFFTSIFRLNLSF